MGRERDGKEVIILSGPPAIHTSFSLSFILLIFISSSSKSKEKGERERDREKEDQKANEPSHLTT